ncbi:MAG: leucine--tRNA ligase, partial [Proteobacteria bacterium]|nr:leucine--tRNA ligase [Pseudomonadota bacterium]
YAASFDWSRTFNTSDPDYYRWTQWIFLKLFERGLAYEAEVPINWCPSCKTGLANEEVKSGRCDRCSHEVTRRGLRQWMLRITAYAERLLTGLEQLDWPEPIKKMQQDWIGRSEGADVDFALADPPPGVEPAIRIYTTRPDTLFGATYMVLSPEHPLVTGITTADRRGAVEAYVQAAAAKSDLQRTDLAKDKTGEFTGAYAINPVNEARIPIWIADYVLLGYGTGAIMAVPAHDQRDHEFAVKFELPIVQVVQSVQSGDGLDGRPPRRSESAGPPRETEAPPGQAFVCDGIAINSGPYTGLSTAEFKRRICADLEARGLGRAAVRFKLRDWVFSRQRYWGEPIPVVHCAGACGVVPLPEDQLPLLLPEVERFEPTGTGESPLAAVEDWVTTTCPRCGGAARRETNTMPQWAGSCWYYLRYIDSHNREALVDPIKERYWMPVDLYVGGAEHAVLHLLYARFWHMVLYDAGVVSTPEPFAALRNQGMILGFSYRYLQDEQGRTYPSSAGTQREDGWVLRDDGRVVLDKAVQIKEVRWEGEQPMHPTIEGLELDEYTAKMSKSLGNVVNPDEIIDQYGADVMRLYEMFMGPFEASCPWNTRDIEGVNRFLHRAWRLFDAERRATAGAADQLQRPRHKTIKKVSEDLEVMGFNTAIAQLMTFVNEMTKLPASHPEDLRVLALLVSPFAPHFGEEVWRQLDQQESVTLQSWPVFDPALCVDEMVTLIVQVNGKKRGSCLVPADVEQAAALAAAREVAARHLEGVQLVKEIYVPRNKLVNLVVRA